jgi:hypothetical protein
VWHDVIHEFLGLVNNKAPAMGLPGNDVRQAIGLDPVEHVM